MQNRDLCDIDEDEFTPYPQVFPTVASQTLPLAFQDSFDYGDMSDTFFFNNIPEQYEEIKPITVLETETILSCSVCGLTNGTLALLDPCSHPLCSACLTSALNIVGEKDMECAVCNAKVADFKLQNLGGASTKDTTKPKVPRTNNESAYIQPFTFMDTSFDEFIDRAQGASTPIANTRSSRRKSGKADDSVVLRIDNVPWVSSFRIYTVLVYRLTNSFL